MAHTSQGPIPEGPIHPGSGRTRKLGGVVVGAGLVALKFGAKAKALLLLLPKLKLLTTSATMLVSVAAYSLIWGWQFAAGFVVLLLLHEMGHVIQLRREGIEASAPMFIPFLGAVISAKSLGDNAAAEARVGLAGPILGSIAAALLIPLALVTGNNLFMALAFTGFLLNLFNLLPIVPLDGGRAMAALSPWMWIVGFVALLAMIVFFPNPILLIIALFGGMEGWRRWKHRKTPEAQRYYKVPPKVRIAVAAVYIGLVVALAIGMAETHLVRHV
ncbi:MAG: site-2 protease family protein [Solirubrobacterales bacterium]